MKKNSLGLKIKPTEIEGKKLQLEEKEVIQSGDKRKKTPIESLLHFYKITSLKFLMAFQFRGRQIYRARAY